MKKKFNTDQEIIDALKEMPIENNATLFIHMTKEGDKNFLSYFLESNVDDLSSMIHQLLSEPGFKSAVYRAIVTHFQFDPSEKMLFKTVLETLDKTDIANMN